MSDNEKTLKLKSFRKELTAKEGEKRYVVFFDSKEGEDIKFPNKEKGTESLTEITVKMKEKDQKDEEAVDKKVKFKNYSGMFFRDVKLPKNIDGTEFKEEVGVPVKGFEPGLIIGLIVLAVVIIGFIWWWVSSSRKEEKEEEGL